MRITLRITALVWHQNRNVTDVDGGILLRAIITVRKFIPLAFDVAPPLQHVQREIAKIDQF